MPVPADERDALTIEGGMDQHARTVENRALNNGNGDAGGVKQRAQVFQSSRRSSGNLSRSDALVMRLRLERSLGLRTGKSRGHYGVFGR
jgi:hypothetical protein